MSSYIVVFGHYSPSLSARDNARFGFFLFLHLKRFFFAGTNHVLTLYAVFQRHRYSATYRPGMHTAAFSGGFYAFAEECLKCKGLLSSFPRCGQGLRHATHASITQLNESHQIFIMKPNEDFPLCLPLMMRHAAHLYRESEKPHC